MANINVNFDYYIPIPSAWFQLFSVMQMEGIIQDVEVNTAGIVSMVRFPSKKIE